MILRLTVLGSGWGTNPLILRPALDGIVYASWASDIAAGDWLGKSGFVDGEPFFFNPLYAYLIAPFFAGLDLGPGVEGLAPPFEPFISLLAPRILAVLVFQGLLGGATTALTALAADRYFGRVAAWVAGLAVAFSHVLVHLDQHLAVSGLGAFLVAAAVFVCAPDRSGESPAGKWWAGRRGPLAKGLVFGLGALARPVSLIAMPILALAEWRRSSHGLRAGILIVLAFFVMAVPTCTRNTLVAGQTYLYTGAGGLNLILGNNPVARKNRSMSVRGDKFGFNPITMHYDARRYVQRLNKGETPSWSEVSAHFNRETIEQLTMHPTESLAHYGNKARWFFSPVEVPSSASLKNDRFFQPLLHLAFAPTWLIASLGLIGLLLHVRRLDVWQGPGSMALAHGAVLTLVFPLSHYRSPVVPALAVLAAGAVAFCVQRWQAGQRGSVAKVTIGVLLVAGIGALPPGPAPLEPASALNLALTYRDMGRFAVPGSERQTELFELARLNANESLVLHRRETGQEGYAGAWLALGELSFRQRRFEACADELERGLGYEPQNWPMRLLRSCALQKLGDLEQSYIEAERVRVNEADQPDAVRHSIKRLAEVLAVSGDPRAGEYAERARAAGMKPSGGCEPR